MLVSIAITLPLVLAALLTLVVALSTGFLTARPPSGADAMGLAVPLMAAGAAWILTLLAAWGVAGRGGMEWVFPRPLASGAVATLAVVGLAVVAIGAFVAWTDRSSAVPRALLPVAGIVLPLALQALLAACAWLSPERLGGAWWPRAAGAAFAVVALAGLAIGAGMLAKAQRLAAANAAVAHAEAQAAAGAERAEAQRRAALTPRDRIAEDLAAIAADESFWRYGAMLTQETDPEARRLIAARGAEVRDLDARLAECLVADYPVLRAGAAEFIRESRQVRPQWAASLAAGMERLASAIRAEGLARQERYTVQLEDELRIDLAAAALFPEADFGGAMTAIRRAVEAGPECDAKTRSLAVLR